MPIDLSQVASDPSRWERAGYPALRQVVLPLDEDLPMSTRGVRVGGGGSLVVLDHYGHQVTYLNVANGAALPIAIRRIVAAGTTATNIVGWF